MNSRLDLHDKLLQLCPNVYYQVPTNKDLSYPCIKYTIDNFKNTHAGDVVYKQNVSYSITVISKNPDDPIVSLVSKLDKCGFNRRFINDNLYHTVFGLHY